MRCWRHCWLCCGCRCRCHCLGLGHCCRRVAATASVTTTAALLVARGFYSSIAISVSYKRMRDDDDVGNDDGTTSSTTRTAMEAKRKIGAKEKINFHSVNFCSCSRMVVFVARRSRTLTLTLCCVVVSPLLPVACEKTDENNNNTNK